ncbi:MAG: hypothetical protein WCL44_01235 [bacterium]
MNNETFSTAIREWLGIDPEWMIEHVGLRSRLSPLLMMLGIGIAVGFAAYMYSRERSLTTRLRAALAVLRSIVYITVILMLFEPFVELVHKAVVRRSVLVLVDRSRSMAIADARKKQADLADAALATGRVAFPVQERQDALSLARQAMIEAAAALRQERFDDARTARSKVAGLLEVALNGLAPGQADAADGFRADIEPFIRSQKGIAGKTEQLEKEGRLNADRRREIAGAQEELAASTDILFDKLRGVSPVVPAGVAAEVAAVPRIDIAHGLIGHPSRALERIAVGCNVRLFSFGERLEPLAFDVAGDSKMGRLNADGRVTAMGGAIEDALARQGGLPVAGVVLLTDGAVNDGRDLLDVARKMKEYGVPLFPVGLGLRAPEDVGVRSLMAPAVIFPNDDVRVRVQVFARGYDGARTDLRVTLDGEEMSRTAVELRAEPEFVEVNFKAPEGRKGMATLAVTVAGQEGEVSLANNTVERQVRMMDQKIKVLFVEGKPRWEYRYLRVILLRDPRLSVKFLMTEGDSALPGASRDYIARYPENPEEAFSYDLVIIGDVPAWYFSKAQIERMAQLVKERGGSLLMIAGDAYAPYSYVDTALADVLPVRITGDRDEVTPKTSPVPTGRGKQSLAMLAADDNENDAVWARVQPLYSVPALAGAKPGANILIELPTGPDRPAPYPLVSWQYAGTGKAMFIGTDQLWRLRIGRGDEYHARFWGQAIQFLALSRLLGENKRIRLETDRTELRAGERLEIHANVLNEFFAPVEAPEYVVQVERALAGTNTPAGARTVAAQIPVKLMAVPGAPGLYQGSVMIEDEGRYTVSARSGDEEFANTVELLAARADPELLEPAMQEDILRKAAEISGGRYIAIGDWPTLPGNVAGAERTVVEHRTRDIWDRWPPYVLIVICLGIEWFMRRRRHLV